MLYACDVCDDDLHMLLLSGSTAFLRFCFSDSSVVIYMNKSGRLSENLNFSMDLSLSLFFFAKDDRVRG